MAVLLQVHRPHCGRKLAVCGDLHHDAYCVIEPFGESWARSAGEQACGTDERCPSCRGIHVVRWTGVCPYCGDAVNGL